MNIPDSVQCKTSLQCCESNHKNLSADIYCINDKYCRNKIPLCENCVSEFHNSHKNDCIPIKNFGQSLQIAYPKGFMQNEYNQLQNSFKEIIKMHRENVGNISKNIQVSEKEYKNFLNDTLESLQKPTINVNKLKIDNMMIGKVFFHI